MLLLIRMLTVMHWSNFSRMHSVSIHFKTLKKYYTPEYIQALFFSFFLNEKSVHRNRGGKVISAIVYHVSGLGSNTSKVVPQVHRNVLLSYRPWHSSFLMLHLVTYTLVTLASPIRAAHL